LPPAGGETWRNMTKHQDSDLTHDFNGLRDVGCLFSEPNQGLEKGC
jgi:hypothetical protein